MQDIPKLIKNSNGTEGFTYFNGLFCFSACKNNLYDAYEILKKVNQKNIQFL